VDLACNHGGSGASDAPGKRVGVAETAGRCTFLIACLPLGESGTTHTMARSEVVSRRPQCRHSRRRIIRPPRAERV